MIRSTKLLAGVAALAALLGVSAAHAASTNFNANATVVAPLAITKTADLEFGSFSPSGTAGTVVITSADVRNVTGGVTANGGTPTASAFNITGAASTAYTITLPATANLTSGGNTMSLAFAAADVTGGSLSRNIGAGGTDTFKVGGTLSVGANQAAGAYTGSFTMTVNY